MDETVALLKEIMRPVLTVDGGCTYCIHSMVDGINDALETLKSKYRYRFDGDKLSIITMHKNGYWEEIEEYTMEWEYAG